MDNQRRKIWFAQCSVRSTTPPQTFGSVTSNLPCVRQSELLTPAELMVLLHYSEKEIGVKSAMEGKSSLCLRSPFFHTHVFDSH